MPGEIVQDSLPTSALELSIVSRLRLERLPHKDSVGAFGELNLDVPTVSQPVFDYLLGHDSNVRPLEVEPGAPVFCLLDVLVCQGITIPSARQIPSP
jgi:hypothetical protein